MATRVELIQATILTILVACLTIFLLRRMIQQPQQQQRPPRHKSITLRIDGIPADRADDLKSNLSVIFDQNPALRAVATFPICRSIAPRDKDSSSATITISTSLSADDLCNELRCLSIGLPYRYNCKFDAITPLYEDPNGADVDLIAVPGLGSHPLGSWKSPENDDVWLRDFLPKDLPRIRVLLYGYDTALPGSLSKQSIEDLGGALLEQVIAFRAKDKTSHRPVIFIGHSLGGLLIKEALVRAHRRRSDTANREIFESCYGLVFFGVPNLGLRNEQLSTLVRGQPNEAFIDSLLVDRDGEPKAYLKRLSEHFSETCKGRYRVVSFFERTLSQTLELDQDGRWRKTGPHVLLVTEKSTTSTGLVAMADEDNIPLHTDHSGLVKYYSEQQSEYTIVRERLSRLVDEAKQKGPKQSADHDLHQPLSETVLACLRSLAFENMDDRHNNIDKAADGTCQWLLAHKDFIEWTRQERGLLWIKGKPGSGKSTLLKYTCQKLPAFYGAGTRMFTFFCHGRGNPLQKTPLGLFRSLLHQMLSCMPDDLSDLVDYFDSQRKRIGEPGGKWEWNLQLLQKYVVSALSKVLGRHHVLVLIDALDECGRESALELIEYFKKTLSSLPKTDFKFGICFSCRHYPVLVLEGGLTIVLDVENSKDITTFVYSQVDLAGPEVVSSKIGETIIQRAQGVFMWARLVLSEIRLMDYDGEPIAHIIAKIEQVPQGLDELYRKLITEIRHQSKTLKLIRWICFAMKPLTIEELQWALAFDSDVARNSVAEYRASDDFITEANFDRRINTLSCGLTEIVSSSNGRIVQFIHQSVGDFFIHQGLRILSGPELGEDVVASAHCHLSRICLQYLRLTVTSIEHSSSTEIRQMFPLGPYAVESWVPHLKLGEPAERSPGSLLQLLQWPKEHLVKSWVGAYRKIRPYDLDCPTEGANLIHIMSKHGLSMLLLYVLESCGDEVSAIINSGDIDGYTPLSLAAERGYEAVVKILLDTDNMDINSKDTLGDTPLSLAARNGHEAVVKILLDTDNVDINSKNIFGDTPLSLAARNGHEAVVKILLDTGTVDANLKNIWGETPLSLAARNGHEAVVKILLGTGTVNANLQNGWGQTPLSLAARNGHEAVVKTLLGTGTVDANLQNGRGQTPLSLAARNGHEAVVKILLGTGTVDISLKNSGGETPLSLAAKRGHEAIVKILLDTGNADINYKDTSGKTPLICAIEGGYIRIVKMLLNTGNMDVNLGDTYGRTPLSVAAERGYEAVVKILLDTGNADINYKDTSGKTPLICAIEGGYIRIVKMLLNTGNMDVNLGDTYGRTPLSVAAERGYEAVVKILLDTGTVDVNLGDNYGRTPLEWAIRKGCEGVVHMLLDTGNVDIPVEDQCELTVMQLAFFRSSPALEEFLVAAKAPISNIYGLQELFRES